MLVGPLSFLHTAMACVGQRRPWAGLPMAIHSFAAITRTNASGYHLLVFFVSILGISMGIRVVCINTLHLYTHTDMYKCN